MAHNLHYNEHTGKYSFFSVQQKTWHNLGQIVDQYPTNAEAIQHSGLNFEVVKAPLFRQSGTMTLGDKGEITVPNNIVLPGPFAIVLIVSVR